MDRTKRNDIRLLVVDDSAVNRAMICHQVAAARGLSVVGVACNGNEALAAVEALRPDVVTLDVQMPDMSGLAVLDEILDRWPTPVIMISGVTQAGAAATLEALDRGAVECVAKPDGNAQTVSLFVAEMIRKIRRAARIDARRIVSSRRRTRCEPDAPPREASVPASLAGTGHFDLAERCVAIGISTGGPPALTRLLAGLRPPMPPIVIVQHMPSQFTGPLASRLNSISALSVREAGHGERVSPNTVLIAPGGRHLELTGRGKTARVTLSDGAPISRHKPSIDLMMSSAAKAFGPNCLGVIMTGMGRDGVAGCRAIGEAGGYVLGQDESSSDVYGMNRAAYVEGYVDRQFRLADAPAIVSRCVREANRQAAVC